MFEYGTHHTLPGTDSRYDPDDGTIHSVSIGRGSLPTSLEDPYRELARGMTGLRLGAQPLNMSIAFSSDPDQPYRPIWHVGGAGDLGALDSVIRAQQSIGAVDISAMTHVYA